VGRLALNIVLLLLLTSSSALAQQKLLPLNRLRHLEIDNSARFRDSLQHTAMRPYLESKWDLSRIYGHHKDTTKYYYKLSVVAVRDHFIEGGEEGFHVTADPLFDLQMSWDFADTTAFQDTVGYYNNTRGARLAGDIGTKISFESYLYENQSQFPGYIRDFNDSTAVIPGQGRWKQYKNFGYDYNSAYGWVSITPNENLNFQIGHGKHFVGHGYRSMLLSDNAANYPYLKGTAWLLEDKIQYSWIYCTMQNLERLPLRDVPESLFKPKAASFYYVNFIPHTAIEIGLFESIIWETWDSTGTQAFDFKTTIPVVGVNSAILGLNGNDNAMLGLNAKIKLLDWLHIYGQVALDNRLDEGTGYQAGLKVFNAGLENLHLQAEYNLGPRNSYRHQNWLQSYTNLNQSIAHPLGTYFEEIIGTVNYRWRRFYTQIKYHNQRHDLLEGGNVLTSNPDDEYQPLLARNSMFDIQAGWLMNPKTNANVSIGWIHRDFDISALEQNTDWVYLTFRTSLFNKYYDF